MKTNCSGHYLPVIAQGIRWILVVIFICAAIPKILDPAQFAQNIANYALVPPILINALALILPWLELIIAILLICRLWPWTSFFILNALLLIFLAALASAYFRGLDIDCGCFSTSSTMTLSMHWYLARDMFFVTLGLVGAWLNKYAP